MTQTAVQSVPATPCRIASASTTDQFRRELRGAVSELIWMVYEVRPQNVKKFRQSILNRALWRTGSEAVATILRLEGQLEVVREAAQLRGKYKNPSRRTRCLLRDALAAVEAADHPYVYRLYEAFLAREGIVRPK